MNATRTRRLSHASTPALAWAAAALAGLLAGCGADPSGGISAAVYPVSGQVLLPGGQPLAGGQVQFLPAKETGSSANGQVGPDGKFTLKSADGRDGAPAGEYKVRVVPGDRYVNRKTGRVEPSGLPFSPQYLDEDGNSGLTATVQAGPTELPPFKLERAPRAVASARR